MKPKILASLAALAVVVAVAGGATIAYFTSEQTSSGNTFAAGSLEFLVDSQCSYNGKACVGGVWDGTTEPCSCVWTEKNLEEGDLFFNFQDLKPEDRGEDTISIHNTGNPSWACAVIDVTADDDISCKTVETEDDSSCTTTLDIYAGDMADNLAFAWWPDDGDNVLETGAELDNIFFQSGAKLSDLLVDHKLYLTLADSNNNFFGTDGDPLAPNGQYYIGTAWCFGDMTIGNDAAITCDGTLVNNESQTDKLVADLSFTAVQQRNNTDFQCVDTYDQEP